MILILMIIQGEVLRMNTDETGRRRGSDGAGWQVGLCGIDIPCLTKPLAFSFEYYFLKS